MKKLVNQTSRFFYSPAFGLLLIRVAVGLLFLLHGWSKISNMPGTLTMLMHFGLAPFLIYFISWLELIGGLALILGIATRIFGFLFGIEMLVAVVLFGAMRGFSPSLFGFEFVLSLVSFGIALAGSGAYSVYKMECKHCGGLLCNGEAGTCTAFS